MSLVSSLEQERDFLLKSLEDLETEYSAGDIDEADYQQLKADYTVRTADVIRRLQKGQKPERKSGDSGSTPGGRAPTSGGGCGFWASSGSRCLLAC